MGVLFVGDVHGEKALLSKLLEVAKKFPVKRRVFLGDYVDRGKDSRGTVDLLLSLDGDNVFLAGNHEEMWISALEGNSPTPWLINGGDATLSSYGLSVSQFVSSKRRWELFPLPHVEFLKSLKVYHEETVGGWKFLAVHGGINPNYPLEEQLFPTLSDLRSSSLPLRQSPLWVRLETLEFQPEDFTLVFGHTPVQYLAECLDSSAHSFPHPIFLYSRLGFLSHVDIDTGAVYGGPLSAMFVSEETVRDGKVLFLIVPHYPAQGERMMQLCPFMDEVDGVLVSEADLFRKTL